MKQYDLAMALATRHTTELYRQVRSEIARTYTAQDLDGECVARNLFQANRLESCAIPDEPVPDEPIGICGPPDPVAVAPPPTPPDPAAVAPPTAPPGRPCGAVGERCSSNRVGVDKNTGEYIVCVYSRDYRPDGVRVTGNIVGVHNIGEPCDP